jgi:hypothetical protein
MCLGAAILRGEISRIGNSNTPAHMDLWAGFSFYFRSKKDLSFACNTWEDDVHNSKDLVERSVAYGAGCLLGYG